MLDNIVKILNKYDLARHDAIRIAEKILNNDLVLKYGYLPEKLNSSIKELKFTNKFNWDIQIGKKTNMAMLHLHSWEPLSYLLIAYHYTLEEKYLEKTFQLIESWYDSSKTFEIKYQYYTHCVADRSIILAYIFKLDYTNKNTKLIEYLVKNHIDYLGNDKNYVKYNHGAMIDRSLIILSLITRNNEYLDKGIYRFKNNVSNTFTENMICVENSITYSIYNLELIVSTQKYILDPYINEISLISNFDIAIQTALTFIDNLKKPNNTFPLYGDGELVTTDSLKKTILYTHYYDHKIFKEYSITTNKLHSFFYPQEGYLIIKNRNFHFFIRCGDIVKNHKHGDDTSFTLYYNKDIFIDPGTYNYDKGEIRNYLNSSLAHNNILVNGEDYDYIKNSPSSVSINEFNDNTNHYHIKLKNNSYHSARIYRNFYILKNDFTLVIIDDISSPLKNVNTQVFNISKEFLPNFNTIVSNNRILINNELSVSSKCLTNFEIQLNNKSIYSEKFHSLEYIPRLLINATGSNHVIATVVSLDLNNDIIDSINENNIEFKHKEDIFDLTFTKEYKNVELENYIHIFEQQEFHLIEVFSNFYKNQDFALYIYKNDIRLDTIWYQDSNKFKYIFNTPGKYRIRCFIRNKNDFNQKREFSMYKIIK